MHVFSRRCWKEARHFGLVWCSWLFSAQWHTERNAFPTHPPPPYNASQPAAESDNGHQSERQPRRILSNALSALGNLLVVFNVVDLFEDGWRNFGSRYEGLTKISGGGDDDDAALGELEGESSDFAMLPNGNKVGGHGHPRSPSLDDDMDFEL